MKRFIYHFSGTYQTDCQPSMGETFKVDGIATTEDHVNTMKKYNELKKVITPEYHERLTIASLSLLCIEED